MNKTLSGSLLVVPVVALALASCSRTETVHWGYGPDDGPERWGAMNAEWALCASGVEQSPIDLGNPLDIDLPAAEVQTPSDQEVQVLNQMGVIDALDNGHTIQINSRTGETLTVGADSYALVQFHFHAPSEHTVDGEHFPMELHFVHQAEDGALAVVGVLIQEGTENPGFAPLWEQLPAPGSQATIRIPAGFKDYIFPDARAAVYHYSGSLTTPPCSEGVQWFVIKTPTRASREQINAFTEAYDHNNRPVQPLNDRNIYLDETPNVTVY
jgi:carbonic anhydrase